MAGMICALSSGFEVAELYNTYVFSKHLPPLGTEPQPIAPLEMVRPRQDKEQADLLLSCR
jgi:hypothetical protein